MQSNAVVVKLKLVSINVISANGFDFIMFNPGIGSRILSMVLSFRAHGCFVSLTDLFGILY